MCPVKMKLAWFNTDCMHRDIVRTSTGHSEQDFLEGFIFEGTEDEKYAYRLSRDTILRFLTTVFVTNREQIAIRQQNSSWQYVCFINVCFMNQSVADSFISLINHTQYMRTFKWTVLSSSTLYNNFFKNYFSFLQLSWIKKVIKGMYVESRDVVFQLSYQSSASVSISTTATNNDDDVIYVWSMFIHILDHN